uniref:Helicase ATP-binding domain-containing protein n=1 Tax=viral metagenome TaxID=1070528 RepID=A0A6C0K937_9ZZZZ
MDTILTHRGYSIPKFKVDAAKTKQMLTDLTVCPKLNKKFASAEVQAGLTFKLFKESSTRWYLPRAYGVETFGLAESSVLSEGLDLSATAAEFKGSPYPYQTDIINSFLAAGSNGLICVPCGKGKTFMALKIAASLGKRFLVVVDKEFLMNQWRGEMSALMPGLRIGILQGPKCEVNATEYDCTICMIQTLCGKDYTEQTFQEYGFTIFDECHHLAAQHFSKTLQKIQTKCMLGLSATPTREDGLTKVFFWFLGKPVYWEKQREPDPTVEVVSVLVKSDDVNYNTVPTDWRGETVMARLLTNVLGCSERTDEIVRRIVGLCADAGRRVLVLSERIGHLNEIERRVAAVDGALTMSYYIGGMKEKVREEGAATARILLASYAMASEAMNIKTLNTVILASPRKHVEQSTGRILRVRPSERVVVPLIVDIVDVHPMYRGQWKKRLAYYKACAYSLKMEGMGEAAVGEFETKVKRGVPMFIP